MRTAPLSALYQHAIDPSSLSLHQAIALNSKSGLSAARGPRRATAAAAAPRRPPRAAAAAVRATSNSGAGASAAAAPERRLDDEALRAQLAARYLPYDGALAAKSLAMARAMAAGGAARAPARERLAAAAVPVYKALLGAAAHSLRPAGASAGVPLSAAPAAPPRAPRRPPPPHLVAIEDWPRLRAAAAAAAAGAAGTASSAAALEDDDLEAVKDDVRADRRRLAATVRMLTDERADCERAILGAARAGGAGAARRRLSAWRVQQLEMQAEALSAEIFALERLLQLSNALPRIEGW